MKSEWLELGLLPPTCPSLVPLTPFFACQSRPYCLLSLCGLRLLCNNASCGYHPLRRWNVLASLKARAVGAILDSWASDWYNLLCESWRETWTWQPGWSSYSFPTNTPTTSAITRHWLFQFFWIKLRPLADKDTSGNKCFLCLCVCVFCFLVFLLRIHPLLLFLIYASKTLSHLDGGPKRSIRVCLIWYKPSNGTRDAGSWKSSLFQILKPKSQGTSKANMEGL